jgi:pSer/pThr/pTyr-binding forkhead associated (FHA) protein
MGGNPPGPAPGSAASPPAYAAPVLPPPAPAGPPGESGWSAVLDDGRRLTIDGLVLLGRNPQPQPGEEDAQLVKLSDETRTVSKSHLAIGLDPAGLYVMDRGSTNGSTVTTLTGQSTRCQPYEVVYVGDGSIVSIGDHWLEIRRSQS